MGNFEAIDVFIGEPGVTDVIGIRPGLASPDDWAPVEEALARIRYSQVRPMPTYQVPKGLRGSTFFEVSPPTDPKQFERLGELGVSDEIASRGEVQVTDHRPVAFGSPEHIAAIALEHA